MKVTPKSLDFPLAMNDPNRGKGLHASDIYGDLFQDLEPKRYKRGGVMPDLKMAIGLAWEQYLEKTLLVNGELVGRPGELVSPEGVLYSPDLLVTNGHDRIGEIKATWMSPGKGPLDPKFDKWLTQIKAYCFWTEIPRARLYALFIAGDYRDIRDPIFNIYDMEFTSRELKENHQLLMNHAKTKGLFEQNNASGTSGPER